MRTYAAGRRSTLLYLRIPAGVPYLMPGLRLAAAAAVVGAVVAESRSAGTGGIGRLLVDVRYFHADGPAKLYAPIPSPPSSASSSSGCRPRSTASPCRNRVRR